jgi:glycosyltransferase involved in cell wall biosynthesis
MNGTRPVSERLRILHIIQNLNYGGMERLLGEMVRNADGSRFESHVLALEYIGRFGRGLDDAAGVHVAPSQGRWSMLRPASLGRKIREIGPAVVHTHGGVWYKASLAARMARVPRLLHTEHGRHVPDPFVLRSLDHLAARRTDTVVAVSEALRQQLEHTVVRGAAPVIVIRNGVDTRRFTPRADGTGVRRELCVESGTLLIGSVGRLEPVKGYDRMIEAFAVLCGGGTEAEDVRLVLVGDGSERSALEDRAQALGLGASVHFLGWRDDVIEVLAALDIFSMSSLSEGTSVSLLEAMSVGICPVVTDVGGNSAVLGPELLHRLVPPDDPPALARAWRSSMSRRVELEADGQTARRRVEAEFSLEAMVRAYEKLYGSGA